MENYDNIPNNVNLNNNEIDLYLEILNNIILKTIEQFENMDQFHKFKSRAIDALQEQQDKLITTIKQYNRYQLFLSQAEFNLKKCLLKLICKLLQENLKLKPYEFHRNKLNKLISKDPIKLFSEARKYYRNNDQHRIELM